MTTARPILLLAAVRPELNATVRRLGLRWQGHQGRGEFQGRPITAAVSGVGSRRMLACLRNLLAEQTVEPEHIVLMGFAGGLDPTLSPGQVLRFSVVRNRYGSELSLEAGGGPGAGPGKGPALLTIDRLATSPLEKQELYHRHNAAAVDMETYPVIEAMQDQMRGLLRGQFREGRRLRLTVLRAISDPADMALPAASVRWIGPHGQPRPWLTAAWLFSNPQHTGLMLRLFRHARRAGRGLADEVEQLLRAPGG